jgi:hypothetical protein
VPDLFTDEYEKAKTRWEECKDAYDRAIKLYDAIYDLLQQQFELLEDAHKQFHAQQAKLIKSGKNPKLKIVKKGD